MLLLSILASIVIWSLLYNLKLAVILITALFIHEYGHYYWMGREGIKDRDMFFMPPFGAVARTKEWWPSYGAELRIALAGPAFGLISVLLFFVLWLVNPSSILLASVALACEINLFNLVLPVSIMDGGRVIKSTLYSINRFLGDSFYVFGFIVLFMAYWYGYLHPIFVLLIGFFIYQEFSATLYHRAKLKDLKIINSLAQSGDFDSENLKDMIAELEPAVNMKKMTGREIVLGWVVFLGLMLVYAVVLYFLSGYIDISVGKLLRYFR